MMAQALLMTYPQMPNRVVDSADFDGTNDNLLRGGGLSGAANSKTGILSYWTRIDGGNNSVMIVIDSNTGSKFLSYRDSTNVFVIGARNAANTVILVLNTTGTYTSGTTWRHVLASWNLADASARHLYINDTSDLAGGGTHTDDTIAYATPTEWGFGSDAASASRFNGAFAEVYFAPGQYLDFSIVSNRRKFISGNGKPVHLGATGSAPTGTAPLVYFHLDDGEAVANFATNRGTGGNFTITGTLDTGSTSPSD